MKKIALFVALLAFVATTAVAVNSLMNSKSTSAEQIVLAMDGDQGEKTKSSEKEKSETTKETTKSEASKKSSCKEHCQKSCRGKEGGKKKG